MINRLLMIAGIIFLSIGVISTTYASVKVSLIDGNKFTDYEVTDQTRKRSLVILERDLLKLFSKISSKHLSENQLMEIDITNIDLPGIYSYGRTYIRGIGLDFNSREMRVVDSNTPFKLDFNYRIKDKSGKIIKQGTHKVREFAYDRIATRQIRHRGTVGYYELPLKKWFKKNFD